MMEKLPTLSTEYSKLQSCLEDVSNHRSTHARRHPYTSVLFLALTTVVAGADTWVEVEEFGPDHRAWFEQWLCLPHGILFHDTFGRVFALLDLEQLAAGFARWGQTAHRSRGGLGRQDRPALSRLVPGTVGPAHSQRLRR